jgi:mRNA interferase MazF
MTKYVPDRYDIIWLNFNPQAGREQSGMRPALVLSPIEYNQKTNLCIICPITSKKKGYYFEVELSNTTTKGVILTDQVKSLDWQKREAEFKEKLPTDIYSLVLDKIGLLIFE